MVTMKIIYTTDLSRAGNDCYIEETVSLIEQFGIYAIIVCQKVTGWSEDENIFVHQVTTELKEALKDYEALGGTFTRESVHNDEY